MTRAVAPSTPAVAPTGIQSDGIYALSDFQGRLRIGRHFLRAARRAGLRVHRFGNRTFIFGADFVRFLESVDGKAGS